MGRSDGHNRVAGVYAITIVKGGTNYMYIGSSLDVQKRITDNLSKLKRNVHHCTELQELYNKGYHVYAETLDIAGTLEEVINTEAEYIEHFKRIDGIEVLNKADPVVCEPRVYLTEREVLKVKEMLEKGLETKQISEKLGVKKAQVGKIRTGYRWRRVTKR